MKLGYARVSTTDQTTAPQTQRLMAMGCDRVWQDVISGNVWDRPGLQELLAYARPGDVIVVVRLDRLGRSLRELLAVVDDMRDKGLALSSLEEAIDTSTASGRLMMHVFGALAQFERTLISERTRDGLAAARQKGRMPGRPKISMEKIISAKKILESGKSVRMAARSLSCGRSTLYRRLREVTEVTDDHKDLSDTLVSSEGGRESDGS